MKHASLAAAVLAVLTLNACKTVPPAAPPNVACQNEPRWFKTDASGKPTIAIFECFRADNVVSYVARQLTAEELAKYQPAAPIPAPAAKVKKRSSAAARAVAKAAIAAAAAADQAASEERAAKAKMAVELAKQQAAATKAAQASVNP